jgi:hypothetical protein
VISLSILLPVASAVAFGSAIANAIASVGVPWLPDVVKVSAVVGVPAVVLTAFDVSGVPSVARVSSLLLRHSSSVEEVQHL